MSKDDIYFESPNSQYTYTVRSTPTPALVPYVQPIRIFFQNSFSQITKQAQKAKIFSEKGEQWTTSGFKYVSENPVTLTKAGVIFVSGLLGVISGYKSRNRRIAFGSLGVAAGATVCYSKEIFEYSELQFKNLLQQQQKTVETKKDSK